MNQNNNSVNAKNVNFIDDEVDDEDPGILAKTGSFISSLFYKVANTINPFKSKKYVQNPYDLNSANDPTNHLNYVDTINNNNNLFISSNFPNYEPHEMNLRNSTKTAPIYYGNNDFEEQTIFMNNNQNNNFDNHETNYFKVDELCNISPHLKQEIYKDIQKPDYIPNEQLFQKAKLFVYENLVKKYKILKPKYCDKTFGESVLLLSIQLTNKYNIEKHYDYLVNQRKVEYKLELNVPEIIKQYYNNRAKTLFYQDLMESSEQITNDVNQELLSKISGGIFNKDKNMFSSENRLICRTPKTKRNYITCLFENKMNYDYLCPNDKVKCQIYKECLLHKENELKNYARVIEVTNNMFKYICNENEKLRNIIKEKEEKIEEYTKQIIVDKIKKGEFQQKIKNYEDEISSLKNSSNKMNNNLENFQKNNISDNINNKNQNIFQFNQNSSNNKQNNEQEIKFKSIVKENNNIFTLRKPIELKNESQKTAKFNSKLNNNNDSNSRLILKENNNNKKTNINTFLVLKNESKEKNDSLNKNEGNNKESEIKKETKLFQILESDDKKGEYPDINNKDNKEVNKEISVFNSYKSNKVNNDEKDSNDKKENKECIENNSKKSKPKFKFGFIGKVNEEQKNDISNNTNTNNIFNTDKIIFGFKPQEKVEQKDQIKLLEKKPNNEKEKEQEINKKDNNEENIEKKSSKKKQEEKTETIIINKPNESKNEKDIFNSGETLNNPKNPFLSVTNIKTNEVFTTNFMKDKKDNNNSSLIEINSTRSTMDATNNLIKLGDNSKNNNSNEKNNNPFINISNNNNSNNNSLQDKKDDGLKKSINPFLNIETNNDNKSAFTLVNNHNDNSMIISDSDNKPTNNIFINHNSNNNLSNINNINNNSTNNSFFHNNKFNSVNNNITNSDSNNPFLSFNNTSKNNINGPTNVINNSENPFTKNPFILNNNNDNSNINTNSNPFITTLTNAIIKTTSNNNDNNNNNNTNNNPFITYNNNINNNKNGSSTNNPFLQKVNNTQVFDNNDNHNNNNNLSSNSSTLFNFKMSTNEDKDKINPFLSSYNGFSFSQSNNNNNNNAFSLGVTMKKNDSGFSAFDSNKSRKYMGFYN